MVCRAATGRDALGTVPISSTQSPPSSHVPPIPPNPAAPPPENIPSPPPAPRPRPSNLRPNPKQPDRYNPAAYAATTSPSLPLEPTSFTVANKSRVLPSCSCLGTGVAQAPGLPYIYILHKK
ncbi:hypothetical protein HanRHA438_Chr09g0406011 [Helianthus annuus]|nr:hypothetical protein HanIR_Chr09g0424851 [Helianthus annuus]KAJ0888796.1 hypothetical protein HanRHA438_Chr09g0406011 [Helianthus annuus]